MLLWIIFLSGTQLSVLLAEVPWDRYIRVVFPFLLTGLSILVVQQCARRGASPWEVISPIVVASAISMVWLFAYQILVLDEDAETGRYRLVSAVFPVVIAYALTRRLTGKSVHFAILIASIVVVAIILVALTRGAALSVACAAVVFLILLRRYSEGSPNLKLQSVLVRAFLVVAVGATVAVTVRGDLFGEWYRRVAEERTQGGRQVTLLTRVAEYSGQIKDVASSTRTLLIGRGLGAQYEWDWQFIGELAKYFPRRSGDPTTHWFAGHGIYVYSIFAGGLLFGWIVPFVFLASLRKSYQIASRPQELRSATIREAAPFPLLVLVGFLPFSVIANPFWLRLGGLTIGLVIGLTWWFAKWRNTSAEAIR
jgi:hypothetical protein